MLPKKQILIIASLFLVSCSGQNENDEEIVSLTLDSVFDGNADLNCIYTPWGLVIDPEGKIFILDMIQNKILVFHETGDFLYEFGRKGEGPGEFNSLFFNFNIDEFGKVYTIDENSTIEVFSNDGRFQRSISISDGRIFDIAALDSSHIYVSKLPIGATLFNSSSNPAVILIDETGETIREVGLLQTESEDFTEKQAVFSCVIDIDQDKSLYYTSVAEYEVNKYDSTGTFIWATTGNCPFSSYSEQMPGYGHTITPVVWDLDVSGNKVFVLWGQEGTEAGYRVDVYDSSSGEFVGYFYSQTPSEERNTCIEIDNGQFYTADYSSGIAYKYNMEYQIE
ncbi:MAG: 6-bladed beta-propeller [Candidatus Sabulitectum sp.]|nr:6-bladed beta-propeller [Candidatus Sabulitectum sp.]